MAFILRSSKYTSRFLGFARHAIFTNTGKKFLFAESANFFKCNELWARNAATAMPNPIQATPFSIDKNISHLYGNLKASMVDLHVVESTMRSIEKNIGALTSSQLLLLLKCCGTAAYRESEGKRIEIAKRIWKTAKDLGTELDIAQYNTLLSIYIENNYKFPAHEILSEIKQAGLEPNSVTYRHLLKAYCQEGDIIGAGKLLEEIKKNNYSINEYDFCSLIQGHCEAGDMDEAEKILKVMKDRGIQPTSNPYAYLLNGYAKFGNIKKMEELLNELNKLEIRMTDSHLLNVVYTLIINNQSDHVDMLMARIKKFNDNEKTLVKTVHRLFHKKKDADALKLFSFLARMDYFPGYIESQALGLVEHFVFNRGPTEIINLCQKIEEEGWSTIACSHALKKSVLRMDLEFCKNFMEHLKKIKFPIRPHYFWPLIVRYAEQGNSGILAVLKVMKSLNVFPCLNTTLMFIRRNYKFVDRWNVEIDNLKKHGIKECLASQMALCEVLEEGKIKEAEVIASTYGIYKPDTSLIDFVAKNFAKNCPQEVDSFTNILYYLAHDFFLYKSNLNQEGNEIEDSENEVKCLNTFFDTALCALVVNCPESVFLNVLQNASKKKMIIPPKTASTIRKTFTSQDVDVLLKEYVGSNEFEFDEDLLKKKSSNAMFATKLSDTNGLIQLANQNDLKAEELFEELGSKASLEDSLAIAHMYSRMKMFDKAFHVIDKMRSFQGKSEENPLISKRFRITLHNLRESGNVEKAINSYKVALDLGFVQEDFVMPIIRTIMCCDNFDKAFEEYLPYFGKIKSFSAFFEIMNFLIPAQKTEAIQKFTELFSQATNTNVALTALYTSYIANGCNAEATELLEKTSFRFQYFVFLFWFNGIFLKTNKTFNDIMQVIKTLRPLDRTQMYAALLLKYVRDKDHEHMKMLLLQCQEDGSTDPFFLEHLRKTVQNFENNDHSSNDFIYSGFSNMTQWNEDRENRKIQGLLRANKCTDEIIEKLLSGKLSTNIARKTLPLLAADGKINELILIINKYRLGRYIPEMAVELLKKDQVEEFLNFATSLESMKKYGGLYNCFATQEERILHLVKTNDEFFQKFSELSQRCYHEGKYEALLVFFIKLCVQVPEKLAKAEELLSTEDSRMVAHFRNYSLSNMLLSSKSEIDFYKNVLGSKKVKSVFAEALDHFYDRVINFYNEEDDIKTALSYLKEAKENGVEEKLSKRLLTSLKKKMEDQGTEFPYPYLLKEAA